MHAEKVKRTREIVEGNQIVLEEYYVIEFVDDEDDIFGAPSYVDAEQPVHEVLALCGICGRAYCPCSRRYQVK